MYRFVPQYRIVGVWFTKPVVLLCPTMGEMAGKTALAKCRPHTSHVVSASPAQAFVFG